MGGVSVLPNQLFSVFIIKLKKTIRLQETEAIVGEIRFMMETKKEQIIDAVEKKPLDDI